jgi:predicted Zn-dependent protease
VDGLLYGDDPVQGFIIGRRFAHPVMRIDFEAPAGVSLTNSPRAVLLDGPDGLRGEFAGGSLGPGTLEAYGQRVLAEAVGNAPANVVSARSTEANGVPAYLMQASVSAQGGAVPVSVLALGAPDRRAYHFLLLSAPGSSHDRVVQSLAASFRLLSAGEAAGLRPRYIRVRPIQPGETAQVLAAQMAADRPREHFLMLNGLPSSTEALPARAVKVVRYARD